jgi:hypothetical protein
MAAAMAAVAVMAAAVAISEVADTSEVVDTSVVADTSVADTSAADTSAADILDTSSLGMDQAHALRSGMDRAYTSGPDFVAEYSRADTDAISGTAVGGITASARAGYGPTITASTCGPAIKVLQRH